MAKTNQIYNTIVADKKYNVDTVIDLHPSFLISSGVRVSKATSLSTTFSLLTNNVDYTINEREGTITLTTALVSGDSIKLERATNTDTFNDSFSSIGSAPAAATLNRDLQLLYIIQELKDEIAALTARVTTLES